MAIRVDNTGFQAMKRSSLLDTYLHSSVAVVEKLIVNQRTIASSLVTVRGTDDR